MSATWMVNDGLYFLMEALEESKPQSKLRVLCPPRMTDAILTLEEEPDYNLLADNLIHLGSLREVRVCVVVVVVIVVVVVVVVAAAPAVCV